MHCVKGITTTFPNRHMKEGKCSVMTGTGLCKPWMPLKIKLMEKSQATATWDLDTRDDQKDYLFFGWGWGYGVNLPACRGLGGGQEEVWG